MPSQNSVSSIIYQVTNTRSAWQVDAFDWEYSNGHLGVLQWAFGIACPKVPSVHSGKSRKSCLAICFVTLGGKGATCDSTVCSFGSSQMFPNQRQVALGVYSHRELLLKLRNCQASVPSPPLLPCSLLERSQSIIAFLK